MKNGVRVSRWKKGAGLWGILVWVAIVPSPRGVAQGHRRLDFETVEGKEAQKAPQTRASQAPAFTIPAEPLGFSSPGEIYLGRRVTLASLDFLDEDRLLFTFRIPGLIRRDATDGEDGGERRVRAVLLALPQGTVEAETVWSLHDRNRYLWPLKDGHFLLRDGKELLQGNSALELKPQLRFPGNLLWIELDPSQRFLVTGSREPLPVKTTEQSAAQHPEAADKPAENPGDLLLRILHRDTGQVMLSTRLRSAIHLPLGDGGYVENQHIRGIEWQLNLHAFDGTVSPLAHLNSTCTPASDFASPQVLVTNVCTTLGEHRLEAISSNGRQLWRTDLSNHEVWPQLIFGRDGSRIAQETIQVGREITASSPISIDDIKGQKITVYDTANGHVALVVQANPILDAGGNVAISPSGRRVAVLTNGSIEIFELPAAPAVPSLAEAPAGFPNGH